MNETPPMPVVLPDYISEANWLAYIALLPEVDRIKAPPFEEARDNVQKQAKVFLDMGVHFNYVEMDVEGWKAWVHKHCKSFTRESHSQYILNKFANQTTGVDHDFVDRVVEPKVADPSWN